MKTNYPFRSPISCCPPPHLPTWRDLFTAAVLVIGFAAISLL